MPVTLSPVCPQPHPPGLPPLLPAEGKAFASSLPTLSVAKAAGPGKSSGLQVRGHQHGGGAPRVRALSQGSWGRAKRGGGGQLKGCQKANWAVGQTLGQPRWAHTRERDRWRPTDTKTQGDERSSGSPGSLRPSLGAGAGRA